MIIHKKAHLSELFYYLAPDAVAAVPILLVDGAAAPPDV
jgi:hypothetical protein